MHPGIQDPDHALTTGRENETVNAEELDADMWPRHKDTTKSKWCTCKTGEFNDHIECVWGSDKDKFSFWKELTNDEYILSLVSGMKLPNTFPTTILRKCRRKTPWIVGKTNYWAHWILLRCIHSSNFLCTKEVRGLETNSESQKVQHRSEKSSFQNGHSGENLIIGAQRRLYDKCRSLMHIIWCQFMKAADRSCFSCGTRDLSGSHVYQTDIAQLHIKPQNFSSVLWNIWEKTVKNWLCTLMIHSL